MLNKILQIGSLQIMSMHNHSYVLLMKQYDSSMSILEEDNGYLITGVIFEYVFYCIT